MDENLKRLEQLRRAAKKRLMLGLAGICLASLLGLALGFFNVMDPTHTLVEKIVIPILVMLIGFFFSFTLYMSLLYTPTLRRFNVEYAKSVVLATLGRRLDGLTYYSDKGIKLPLIEEAQLIERGNTYLCNDFVGGLSGDIAFSQCAAAVQYRMRKSKNRTAIQPHFQGRWILLEREGGFGTNLYVLSKHQSDRPTACRPGPLAGMQAVSTGDAAFDTDFEVYASGPRIVTDWLTPERKEGLRTLCAALDGKVLLAVRGKKLHIAIAGARNYLEGAIFRPVNEQTGADYLREFEAALAFANTLIPEASKAAHRG